MNAAQKMKTTAFRSMRPILCAISYSREERESQYFERLAVDSDSGLRAGVSDPEGRSPRDLAILLECPDIVIADAPTLGGSVAPDEVHQFLSGLYRVHILRIANDGNLLERPRAHEVFAQFGMTRGREGVAHHVFAATNVHQDVIRRAINVTPFQRV